jgi:hypothetical protein
MFAVNKMRCVPVKAFRVLRFSRWHHSLYLNWLYLRNFPALIFFHPEEKQHGSQQGDKRKIFFIHSAS